MPTAGQIASGILPTAAGIGTSAAVGTGTLLGMSAGPAGAVVGAGVGALMTLLSQIGQGRKTANLMTEGGPQDILNQQLTAIVNDPNTNAQEKAQATQTVWTSFLQQANTFAQTQGGKAPTVVQQAIYKTPGLTNTINTLLAPVGQTAFDPSYTSIVPGITATGINKSVEPGLGGGTGPGGSVTSGLINAGIGAGAGLASGYLFGGGGNNSASTVNSGGIDYSGATTVNADGEIVPAGSTGGPVYDENGDIVPGAEGGIPSASGAAGYPSTGGPSGGGSNNSILQSILSGNKGLLPTLIGAGTSLTAGALGANAATTAAQIQAQAAEQAAQLEYQSGQNALQFEQGVFNTQQANEQPWLTAGSNALNQIAAINATPYTLPTEQDLMNSPQVQAQLNLGEQALQEYERSQGKLMSGGAAKDIDSYAQQVAQTGYNNLVQNQLAARSANLNPLLSVAGLGQTSAGSVNSAIGNTGSTIANTGTTTAAQVGNTQQQAAAAQASGYVGAANAYTGAISNIGNNIQNSSTIQAILSALKTPNTPSFATP